MTDYIEFRPKPDSQFMHREDRHTTFDVELGEGTAYLSFVSQNTPYSGDPQPEVIVSFEGRTDVEEVRRLALMMLAWADDWQDEFNRFKWAAPCGINVHPDAQPNPACPGFANCHDEECQS